MPRQAQEIGPHAGLLAREESAGAAAADRDLVGDQVHAEFVAQRAQPADVRRIVHCHAGRALHERLDDQRGDPVAALDEQAPHVRERAARDVGGRFARQCAACVG